jgi:hypothetical protein
MARERSINWWLALGAIKLKRFAAVGFGRTLTDTSKKSLSASVLSPTRSQNLLISRDLILDETKCGKYEVAFRGAGSGYSDALQMLTILFFLIGNIETTLEAQVRTNSRSK